MFAQWFEATWRAVGKTQAPSRSCSSNFDSWPSRRRRRRSTSASSTPVHDLGDELTKSASSKSATGIRNTQVWKKLFKFQRDGVVGAIDKLERLRRLHPCRQRGPREDLRGAGGHQVLRAAQRPRAGAGAPNACATTGPSTRPTTGATLWRRTGSTTTSSTTPTSARRRQSGDIDLAHVNWGNYDLVVIDESHNFRNKKNPARTARRAIDRLMRQIIQEGVKTKVLMLSATR